MSVSTHSTVLFGDEAAFDQADERGIILAATNGAERGNLAVAAAAELARQTQARLRVETVLDGDMAADEKRAAFERLQHKVREICADLGQPVAVNAQNLPDHFSNSEYGRAEMLLKATKDSATQLIVVGPHQGARPIFGTMTESLLRRTRLPVLIAGPSTRPYQQVLVAVDFSSYSSVALAMACRWAPSADIHLLHVDEPKLGEFQSEHMTEERLAQRRDQLDQMIREQMRRLEEARLARPRSISAHIEEGVPHRAIAQRLQGIGADLLVLGVRGQTGLAGTLLGGVATKFITHPSCAVMLVKTS